MKMMLTMLPLMALGECMQTYGSTYCDAGNVDELNASGIVNINRTHVMGASNIKGSLNAQSAIFKSLNIYGNAYLKNVKVNDGTKITGYLEAIQSHFENLDVAADKVILDQTSINHLVVTQSQGGITLIVLKNGSKVNGNICFKGVKGHVRLEGGSTINGQVINGDVTDNN